MSNLFSRFSISDLAVLTGCLGILALMIAFGPGRFEDEGSEPTRAVAPELEPGFWETWPGALVATLGGGGLIYGLLVVWSAGHH